MNLYLISQTELSEYDTYDSAVVCATDENAARWIHPNGMGEEGWRTFIQTWCSSPDLVTVELIGEAAPGVSEGVVCSSFNAG